MGQLPHLREDERRMETVLVRAYVVVDDWRPAMRLLLSRLSEARAAQDLAESRLNDIRAALESHEAGNESRAAFIHALREALADPPAEPAAEPQEIRP